MVITSLALAILAHLHLLAIWHLALASFINGVGWATDNPVRRVMIGEAVGAAQMGKAMSLDVGANNASRMVGPMIGGLLLASVGIDGVFTFSVVLYAVAVVAACRVRYRNSFPPITADSVLARIAEGLRAGPRRPAADRHADRHRDLQRVRLAVHQHGAGDRPGPAAARTGGHRHPGQHGRHRLLRRRGADGDVLPPELLPRAPMSAA